MWFLPKPDICFPFFIFLYFILQPCEPFDKSSELESIFVEWILKQVRERESLVCRPLIILTRELFYHQNERTRFNGFSSCVLTIKLVPRITMLINIHITLKHIFGFKDSIFWPFASVNGFQFKDNGPNEWKTILFNVQMKCPNLLTSLEYFLYSNNVLLFEALKELLYRINCLVLVQLICKIVTKWKPILNILF